MSRGSDRGAYLEAARLALEVMRDHRLRSGLVILGVSIGVAVLMTMVSILSGLSGRIEQEMTQSDRSIVTLSKFDIFSDPSDSRVQARPEIDPEDAKALTEQCASVGLAEFLIDANRGTVIHYRDQRTRPIPLHGGGAQFLHVYSLPVAEGRAFTPGEVRSGEDVVFLGYGPARDLFGTTNPIGKRVRLGSDHFTVVGVGAERNSLFGGAGDNYAFLPWTTFQKSQGQDGDPYYVYMTVAEGYESRDVVEDARAVMRARHRLRPGEEDDFALIENDRINDLVKRVTGPIGLVLLVLSSIGLSVGGIGVMNIMLVSVTERTREVGIRMALGARRRIILAQFLVEAATLTGIGGVLGVLAGAGLAYGLSWVSGLPAAVSPWAALAGVVFSAGIGLFFGLYPASKAAKLNPIDALRYE